MLNLPAAVQVFVCTHTTDMRRSFDGLVMMAEQVVREDPFSGHLFVFFNRRRDRVKILYWDRSGPAIWYKRLEEGTFRVPLEDGGGVELDALDASAAQACTEPATANGRKADRRGHGRKPLPRDLPRKRVEHEPAPQELTCRRCGRAKERFGEEVSEQLEYVPASLCVIEHVCPKYACPHCREGVVRGSKPMQPIENGSCAAPWWDGTTGCSSAATAAAAPAPS